MDDIVAPRRGLQNAAEHEAAIAHLRTEVRHLNEQVQRDHAEIDRLKAEAGAIKAEADLIKSRTQTRLDALEAEVACLKQAHLNGAEPPKPWWEEIWGTFKNDAEYEEAMRLGRQYRESLRPKADDDEPSIA